MSVKDGRLVLPDGMSYRVLVLPRVETMTPRLLAQDQGTGRGRRDGRRPAAREVAEPGRLSACDEEVKKLAEELWGDCDGKSVKAHSLGRGRVVWGKTPEQVLVEAKVPVDLKAEGGLSGKVRYIHRRMEDGTDIYFVANATQTSVGGFCSFRAENVQPMLLWPETGRVQHVGAL